ncbi:MAG: hypothetical protein EBU93_06425 [Chlamydiae bacterium]|nr:hypothetical protein [Chlamydiota bacterium]
MQKWIAKCLLLIAIICFTGCEKHQAVITGVDEREANLIVVFLDSKNAPNKEYIFLEHNDMV